MKSSKEQSSTASSTDVFGTYLEEVKGRTAIEQILARLKAKPQSVGQLTRELSFSPEEIASAIAKASQLGMVDLETTDDETLVSLTSKSAA
jgi:hypothetical protein